MKFFIYLLLLVMWGIGAACVYFAHLHFGGAPSTIEVGFVGRMIFGTLFSVLAAVALIWPIVTIKRNV